MSDAERRTQRSYWRSLERLYESPALADLAPEFAEDTGEPPDGVTRRSILQLMGASLALAGLAGCRRPVEYIVPYVNPPEEVVPGIPRHYATTYPAGLHAYGVVVESHEERPTKLEGNAAHPFSRGAASGWMQASTLNLYDPDRSRRIMQRKGETVNPVSYDAFIDSWKKRATELAANGGEGLAVLLEPVASPTLTRLLKALRDRFPRARVVAWEPLHEAAALAASQSLFGRSALPLYHLDQARTVLALDCDLFLSEPEAVIYGRDWAAARNPRNKTMARLYAAESTLSLTGANADHRIVMRGAEIPLFAAAVASELSALGITVPGAGSAPKALSTELRKRAAMVARDLAAAGRHGLVAAGRMQSAAVHELALAINAALGAIGTTLTLHAPQDAELPTASGLHDLAAAMQSGAVTDLIMLGGNPVYSAPVDLDFAGALSKVQHTVHLSSHLDETSELVEWHLPETHYLEAWGDARAIDGTASVIQPLIAPLYDGHSAIELVGVLATDQEQKSYEAVRQTWKDLLPAGDFETGWRQVLHDGVLADSAVPSIAATSAASAAEAFGEASKAPVFERLELTFHPSRSVFDGRFANNPWLQEMPDPVTKITWRNVALMAPATAKKLGVKSGDVVVLRQEGRKLKLAAWALPGQAEDSIALEVGYGRTRAGKVGNGRGANAYDLRTSTAPAFVSAAALERVGRWELVPQTQQHGEMAGRDLVREADLDEFRKDPKFAQHPDEDIKPSPLYPQEHSYESGHQWAMTVDLNACTGCNACVIACQSENNIPVVGPEQVSKNREMQWLRVDRYFTGSEAAPSVVFQPVPCMQCENAPCEEVCPVGATVHDREGLNVMVYNRCIGTRYCSNNCPYKVRHFNFFNYTKDTPQVVRLAMNPDVTVRSRGVMEKCTYCIQRIREAEISSHKTDRPIPDGEVKTACQQTCPADAIRFGDQLDPKAAVLETKKDPRNYILLAELETKPRTSYLAGLRNHNPAWEDEDA